MLNLRFLPILLGFHQYCNCNIISCSQLASVKNMSLFISPATSKIEEGKGQEEGGLSAPGSEESRAQKSSEPTVWESAQELWHWWVVYLLPFNFQVQLAEHNWNSEWFHICFHRWTQHRIFSIYLMMLVPCKRLVYLGCAIDLAWFDTYW